MKIFRALAVAGLLLSVTAQAAETEPNTDRPGADFTQVATDGPAACLAACRAESACVAYTYVPGWEGENGTCFLKDYIPPAQTVEGMTSGVIETRDASADAAAAPESARGLPAGWADAHERTVDGPEAELLVRTGDIDNLSFGWPAEFDPFTGESTPVHPFPWMPGDGDPEGTDRIMLGSSTETIGERADGYSGTTARPDNAVRPIVVEVGALPDRVTGVLLQMFIDDFQAPNFGSRFEVSMNGRRLPYIEQALNAVDQTGPVGKLISLKILKEDLEALRTGRVELLIDDTTSGAADAFAVDFVRLLVNPRKLPYTVALDGIVVDAETGAPIPGASVSAALGLTETGGDGAFHLAELPAGLVIATAGHPDYESAVQVADLVAGSAGHVRFALKPRKETLSELERQVATEGRASLRGIYFDFDSANLRSDSAPALEALLALVQGDDESAWTIEGHTDSKGSDGYNLRLSQARAQAVVDWLAAQGVDAMRLSAAGFGAHRPVADNGTAAGQALNRRVEVVRR